MDDNSDLIEKFDSGFDAVSKTCEEDVVCACNFNVGVKQNLAI